MVLAAGQSVQWSCEWNAGRSHKERMRAHVSGMLKMILYHDRILMGQLPNGVQLPDASGRCCFELQVLLA
jgi:hypothetical protein